MLPWITVLVQLMPTILALIKQIEEVLDDGPEKKAAVCQAVTGLVDETALNVTDKEKVRLAATGMIDPLVATLNETEWKDKP